MLNFFFRPSSVAVIGASKSPGKVGYAILRNLVEGGFKGEIVPVNPGAQELLGRPCYPDLAAYGKDVDLVVVVVPVPAVRAAVDSALAANAKSVVVITAGFKETGADGAALERELAQQCAARGVRMLGPNCLGYLHTQHALNASFAKKMPDPGVISVVSQSGALCTAMLDWFSEKRLGLTKLVSLGNKADLDECDFLSSLADDPDTRVIMLYLESIAHGNRFIKAAENAAAKKPVVILKSGTTSAGQKATSSHTGSLAGADIAYGAAFRRSGVIRADGFDELMDFTMSFALQPVPKGDRVAVITNAGGPGAMCADAVENAGLRMADLSPAVAAGLKSKLPPAASVGNPVDVLGDAEPDRYELAVKAALGDPQVDALVVILTPQAMTKPLEIAQVLARHKGSDKPILAVWLGGSDVAEGVHCLIENGIPDLPSPERAVKALRAMLDYQDWRSRPPRVIARLPVNRRRVDRILNRYRKSGATYVGEVDAKEIFRAYDFAVPPGALAASADEAAEIADRVGYPVVMKVVSPDIIHKSDVGGVKLNLSSASAVRDAFDLMMLRIRQHAPEARLLGAYVEKMGARGVEVILGMTRDPQFGPMLMFGLGGIFVEVMKDVTFHLAPVTAEEAMQMLQSTKSYALLKGARGQGAVDMNAIAQGLMRISQLVTDYPEIAEMDINPFIVGPVGVEPTVADGRLTLRPEKKAP
jgi:acetyltransferase